MVIVGAKEIGKFMDDCSATVLALSELPQALPVVVVPLAIAPVCEEAHPAPPGFDQAVDRLSVAIGTYHARATHTRANPAPMSGGAPSSGTETYPS
jgi:hypothetical protein